MENYWISGIGEEFSLKVIYDCGANEGMNIDYFMAKADRVIAIEANPELSTKISQRFPDSIKAGKLLVINAVLTVEDYEETVPFYIHKTNSVLSQFPKPPINSINSFTEVMIPAIGIKTLISRGGDPYYIKLDLESFDGAVLSRLFELGIRPPYISAEAHTSEILDILESLGSYHAFKIVNGSTVHLRYAFAKIKSSTIRRHRFTNHSSGPFGEDISGPWFSAKGMRRLLAAEGLGWKDIHATQFGDSQTKDRPSTIGIRARLVGRTLIARVGKFRSRFRLK